jgi:phage gpG-like protein
MMGKATAVKDLMRRMPRWMGDLAIGHSMANFKVEGFIDQGKVERWPSKRGGLIGIGSKKLLVDTGRMKRSIKIMSASSTKAVVGSNVPYSGIHNRPVGEYRKYATGTYPGRKFLGHSSELVKVTVQMIISRMNLGMRK